MIKAEIAGDGNRNGGAEKFSGDLDELVSLSKSRNESLFF
jgi:hypothetical protein